jgi:YtcA family
MKAFGRLTLVLLPAILGGCRSMRARSPTIDVLGSYFPAWLLCIVVGLALTLVTRQLLVGFKLNVHLHPAALVYPCMILLFALAVWLVFFSN